MPTFSYKKTIDTENNTVRFSVIESVGDASEVLEFVDVSLISFQTTDEIEAAAKAYSDTALARILVERNAAASKEEAKEELGAKTNAFKDSVSQSLVGIVESSLAVKVATRSILSGEVSS